MSKLNRRQATRILIGSMLAAPSIVKADTNRPIFLVVPYGAGGVVDIIARRVAKSMSITLKQPVLVENKPGATGIVAAQYVARAPKDGYTILVGGTAPISLNVMLRKNLPYKVEDFASVALLSAAAMTLTVNTKKIPVNDVKGFVKYAKSRTKPVLYATTGRGSVTNLLGLIMAQSMDIPMTDVPYRSNPASIPDLLSGACDLTFATPFATMGQVKAGKLKILALTAEKRNPRLPDVPTFAESGYPELTASFWTGLLAPAGTPRDMIVKLNEAANFAMKSPEIAKQMAVEFQDVEAGPPSRLDAQLAKDVALWGPVIKSHKIEIK